MRKTDLVLLSKQSLVLETRRYSVPGSTKLFTSIILLGGEELVLEPNDQGDQQIYVSDEVTVQVNHRGREVFCNERNEDIIRNVLELEPEQIGPKVPSAEDLKRLGAD